MSDLHSEKWKTALDQLVILLVLKSCLAQKKNAVWELSRSGLYSPIVGRTGAEQKAAQNFCILSAPPGG
jgi:hypothetical protein